MVQHQEKSPVTGVSAPQIEKAARVDVAGLTPPAEAYSVYQWYRRHRKPLVVVTATAKQADQYVTDLSFYAKGIEMPILYFPPYHILPYKYMAYHNETAAHRICTLYRLTEHSDGSPPVIVTTVGALMQKVLPKAELINFVELIMVGEDVDLDGLIRTLISGGYSRSTIVEEPGDFCVRGGILDIFSPLYPEPLRAELFGDTIESLRFFSPATQRTTREIHEAIILPAKEAILKKEGLDQFLMRVRTRAAELEIPVTRIRELAQRIKTEGIFPGIESLISLIYSAIETFFDYTPGDTRFFLSDPSDLENTAKDVSDQIGTMFEHALQEKLLCVEPDALYLDWPGVQSHVQGSPVVAFKPLAILKPGDGQAPGAKPVSGEGPVIVTDTRAEVVRDNTDIGNALKSSAKLERPLSPFVDWIKSNIDAGHLTLIVCGIKARAERMNEVLRPYDIKLQHVDTFPDNQRGKGVAYLIIGDISAGFVWPSESIALIAENEIFQRSQPLRTRSKSKVHIELLQFEDLKQGDLVVHTEHGIGQYEGLTKLGVNGSLNEFLLILYKDEDKLYLPVERMGMIQKYMGVEGVVPVLDKMGGKAWDKIKQKVKRSAEKIAGELLKLYASRKVREGHAFGASNTDFREFENGFGYDETQDQQSAIERVLADMHQPTPMDRLVCGDVGYGKTEVALRASFLAISEAKQVAVLVPTTVLAEQHYETFRARFNAYPVNVACLSRFRPVKVQREIVTGIKNGTVDIVIGTHRLLQKDIEFKDLGLLVLDEEQRFGVTHKEKLKRYRSTVDVLTLTATPIPRTLHMSLLGVRDISVISTPPEDRRPIITYVSEFDDAIVSGAIRKELKRKGQIFFVHNNINSIDRMAGHIRELVPEARLDVAHGRQSEQDLENAMYRFMTKKIDILVCTTIIESGLDVASANTIIINRADRFGLSQIYQLRGRVGRSDEQAYAYLFIPPESNLNKNAIKRLKVLMEHSNLGAGFQIAMSDLKIRGGGTILGASQSGHIAAVGYDMFLKLMETSIAELKGEPIQEGLEPEVNVAMSAFLPESFIPDIDQRLSFYRQLARMTDLKEISTLKSELIDRYGALPSEAANLLLKIMLKTLSIKAGVKKLDLLGQTLGLTFSELHQQRPFAIVDMINSDPGRYRFTPDHVLRVILTKTGETAQLAEIKNILIQIAQHVNS
ncbi:MAG: transcription-repair coupling factor [Desulfobacteraceae bacterium]|nr:transcription-repair coupling factor [Desulfobacteraceae bacterium]